MNKKSFGAAPVGGSLLLMIFAVLCLTVFALLCLASASAGQRLTEKSVAAAENYYSADSSAEEILAELKSGNVPDGVTQKDGLYTFACPVSDTLALAVCVRLEGEECTVLSWKTVQKAQWTPDQSLNLWDGKTS